MRISFRSSGIEIQSLACFLWNYRRTSIGDDPLSCFFRINGDFGRSYRRFALISEALSHERDIFPRSLNFDLLAGYEVSLIEVVLVHRSLEDLANHADVHGEEISVEVQASVRYDIRRMTIQQIKHCRFQSLLLSLGVIIIGET